MHCILVSKITYVLKMVQINQQKLRYHQTYIIRVEYIVLQNHKKRSTLIVARHSFHVE